MAPWQKVWRNGYGKLLTREALTALLCGLEEYDVRIVQGTTTRPGPNPANAGLPIEAGCVVCYALWRSGAVATVGEAEEAFAALCFEVDTMLGYPAACRVFLNWFDEAPRSEVLPALLAEVRRSVALRNPVSV